MLKKAPKLRLIDEYRDMYILQDLTPEQQTAGKLVRDELKRQNNPNTKGQLANSLNVCNVNNSCIKHTVQNKKWKSDTLSKPKCN